jgi:hypothetical protein
VERRGCDGDAALARRRFAELDGRVDALGVGGIDLWVGLDDRRYPIRAAQKLVHDVRVTPVVDGSGLKQTLENRRRRCWRRSWDGICAVSVLTTSGIDRFGLSHLFCGGGLRCYVRRFDVCPGDSAADPHAARVSADGALGGAGGDAAADRYVLSHRGKAA